MTNAGNMFNNWINIHDLERFWEKAGSGGWRQIVRRASAAKQDRTRSAWEHTQSPPIHAWEIPELRRRWNFMVSGNAQIDHVAHVKNNFLAGKTGLAAFSPGCGGGGNEMSWARTGLFRRIDACDLSQPRIAAARRAAEQAGLDRILNFQVGDVGSMAGAGPYDLVITEGALHHFFPMRRALEEIRDMLRPGGFLVINEFVGPSRFQWTGRQLQAANELLNQIPEAYRRRWENGRVKKRIDAPGRLRMMLADPSEAAESSAILPLLNEMFLPLEVKEKGGTLACLVFHGIAHHFLEPEAEAEAVLRRCFAVEDSLMKSGEITSDYVFGVFGNRAGG